MGMKRVMTHQLEEKKGSKLVLYIDFRMDIFHELIKYNLISLNSNKLINNSKNGK